MLVSNRILRSLGLFAVLAVDVLVRAQYDGAPYEGAQYKLDTNYDVNNFLTSFDFFTEKDPTNGFVEFVDLPTAQAMGLVRYLPESDSIYLGVDSMTFNPPRGRRSLRLTSQKSFTHGLFLADISHMPGSICGIWPALWMFGPNWPISGEIDIIEGVNSQTQTAVTLHTAPGCSVSNSGTMLSTSLKTANCGFGGCGQQTADRQNYGDGFNAIKGGIYAMEWTSGHIAIWFFPRYAVPSDILYGRPEPSSWGPAVARFNGGQDCDLDSYFSDNRLVLDTTFCGDWAGGASVWARDAKCSAKAATCNDYVAAHPADFAEAFWEIHSIKVYQLQNPGELEGAGELVAGPYRA